MRQKDKVLNWIDENEDKVITLLQDMLQIASVNPWFEDDTYPTKEKNIQAYLKNYLENMGFETQLWEPDAAKLAKYEGRAGYYAGRDFTDRPNLLGTIKGNGTGNSVLLTGHVDVVKAGEGWTKAPFGGEVEDGKIYGRGAADMKGGIAAMIMAVQAIQAADVKLDGDVFIGTVADEEAGGMGTLALADFLKENDLLADACILTEATSLNIAPISRGILWGRLIIEGRSGHIEMPQGDWRTGGAVDAIDKMHLYLDQFKRLNADWAVKKVHSLLPIPCQINIAQVNAGEYPTSFANHGEIIFNAQYLPHERDELRMGGKVKQEISDFVSQVAKLDPWLAEHPPVIEWLVDADCAETNKNHPFVRNMAASLREINEYPMLEGICAHTDMGWFVNVGMPTINFGPGEPRIAHQVDEYIPIDELIRATKALAMAILNWCGYERA
ncbi:ArgE/DapE family deacylase [Oceanobacillus sp. CFH 90083]|uniref:ArgE/DapE family deacylase n=1 Tax=Oceanobacillus sp. CFH 90083 TaxID=2592336 RepID=UPI00128C281B|nr:ArgE/DapE family deacylase [Oceanobacillus sp. CFH 90083]